MARLAADWAMITTFHTPAEDRFAFELTMFNQNPDGTWRRDDERHDLVLNDTDQIPSWLADTDIELTIGDSFGGETLPAGLATIVARRSVLKTPLINTKGVTGSAVRSS
jgi:hypothetical protein